VLERHQQVGQRLRLVRWQVGEDVAEPAVDAARRGLERLEARRRQRQ
jgi:hypothetical protein